MMPPALELTLVLAATSRDMGIGLRGQLPWTGLCKEMAYFARVTRRIVGGGGDAETSPSHEAVNAIIMGRKTWDSIPSRFRPLKGRINVVISRFPNSTENAASPALYASSLTDAITQLRSQPALGRTFVIGGAQVYHAALGLEGRPVKRLLLTRVLGKWECDTFVEIEGLEAAGDGERVEEGTERKGWRRCTRREHGDWIGEEVPEGVVEEGNARYEFEMWERV